MDEAQIRELLSLQRNLEDIKIIEKTKIDGINKILVGIENLAKLDTSITNLKSSLTELRKAIEAKIDESNKSLSEQINKLSEEIKKIKIQPAPVVVAPVSKAKETKETKTSSVAKENKEAEPKEMTPEDYADEFIRKFKPVVGRKITNTDIGKTLDITDYSLKKRVFDILKKRMTIAPNGVITKMNNK